MGGGHKFAFHTMCVWGLASLVAGRSWLQDCLPVLASPALAMAKRFGGRKNKN